MTENEQKADLIKKALIIVDKLADMDIDIGGENDDVVDLIEEANKLKKDRLWKLK